MRNQAPSGRLYSNRNTTVRQPKKGVIYVLLAAICLLVATSAYWLSKKNSAERRQEAPVASTKLPPPTTPASEAPVNVSTDPESAFPEDEKQGPPLQASTSAKPLTGAYSVLPARAYFHAEPDVNSSTGKYVLRNDIVYAEGESGNFIKTRFFNSDGDPVIGWLKKTDVRLRQSAAKPTLRSATAASPSRPIAAPEAARNLPKKPAVTESVPESTAASTAVRQLANTGTVRVDTTYFYNSSDLTQRRRAFCIRGDRMTLTDSSEKAVFATFINWEKVKTSGWIRKQDLTIR